MAQSIYKLLRKGQARRERIKTQLASRNVKAKARKVKSRKTRVQKSRALPKPTVVLVNTNYVNPVTLAALTNGSKAYKVRNRTTGRVNYYNKVTLFKLLPSSIKNNYSLLIAPPKNPLFRNPITRGDVYPRNITTVIIKHK